ncbi:hypothetical protein EST38_g5685 [Candolleomyces aberdarensis]|uniref:Serine protease n=1 Tax=Candolleomyces aberdarensis TaxID=2316362 RepID=A0A4Q2DLL0_9AGAR|nr:hypothetical protein EST38_g5685 [Candolleomyces aberdarensis]
MAKETVTPPSPSPITPPASPCVIGDREAYGYFYGQFSRPKLVARSDSSTRPWASIVGGYQGWPTKRYFANVGYHERLASFWLTPSKRDELVELLDSMSVQFTTIDPVRIVEPKERDYTGEMAMVGHRALAVAIKPDTLSREKGLEVVVACKALLQRHGIDDVECLIREAECFSSAGPLKFEEPTPFLHGWTAHIHIPTTSTLGTSIATTRTPEIEGTRGFYVASKRSGKLYFLTCRHVVLPCNSAEDNVEYKYTDPSQPRIGVIQPSPESFEGTRKRAKKELKDWENNPNKGGGTIPVPRVIEQLKPELPILDRWKDPSDRVIGHVVYSPPLVAGAKHQEYTLDVAVCEVDPSLLDANNFLGNVVDWGNTLGFCLTSYGFEFSPETRLQRLNGFVPMDEMVKPGSKSLSEPGEDTECLVVSKRGAASEVTFGKANNLPSLRTYEFGTGSKLRALQWGIFRFNQGKTKNFSERGGDSGATVFDSRGRIFGLVTGWSGNKEDVAITYAMPAEFAVAEISKRWEKVHTNVLEREPQRTFGSLFLSSIISLFKFPLLSFLPSLFK